MILPIPLILLILYLPLVSALLVRPAAGAFILCRNSSRAKPCGIRWKCGLFPTGNTTTPIANPEGETKVSQTISLLVRLDVVGTAENGVPASGQSRLRATYEQSRAQTESDAFNPDVPSVDGQYANLEGRSIEFTLMPDGHLANITGARRPFPHSL